MNKFLIIALIVIVAIGGYILMSPEDSTIEAPAENENILTFNIEPETKPCVGVGPMDCMVVNGEFFYDQIEGFTFEPGYEYVLEVERTERENVPADASKYTYALIEEVSKTPVNSDLEPLSGNGWYWKETLYNNDDLVSAADPSKFLVTFKNDGTFSATTDCNNGFGSFEVEGNNISFGPIASTKKACLEPTQEMEFFKMLEETDGYLFTEEGDLVLTLKLDTGSMILSPAR